MVWGLDFTLCLWVVRLILHHFNFIDGTEFPCMFLRFSTMPFWSLLWKSFTKYIFFSSLFFPVLRLLSRGHSQWKREEHEPKKDMFARLACINHWHFRAVESFSLAFLWVTMSATMVGRQKKKKKNWLKRPKATPQKWKDPSIRSSGHHQSFFCISDFPAENLTVNKNYH